MNVGQGRTERALQAALNGLSTRQRVISNNVANADTPEFKAGRVDFEAALRRSTGRAERLAMLRVPNAVAGPDDADVEVRPTITTDRGTTIRADGNNVDIDYEMIQLAETNIAYNAVTQLIGGRLQLLRTIINDGRR